MKRYGLKEKTREKARKLDRGTSVAIWEIHSIGRLVRVAVGSLGGERIGEGGKEEKGRGTCRR